MSIADQVKLPEYLDKLARSQTKSIEIFDGLVPQPLADTIWKILNQPNWRWGQRTRKSTPQMFWSMDLNGQDALIELLEIARPHLAIPAGETLVPRNIYANGHTYGLGGAIHRDNPFPDFYTLLYYANPEWHPEFAGETLFYDDDVTQVQKSIMPCPGRLAFFDSRIPHFGSPPSREFWGLRVTVAFKLEAVKTESLV